jgi:hypothetical protein
MFVARLQNERESEHRGRAAATRRRRQSVHDLHRASFGQTPSPHGNFHSYILFLHDEELDGPAVSALGVQSRKLSNVLNGQS